MMLSDLLKGLKYKVVKGDVGLQCFDITSDSREVKKGTCFFAIRGTRFDGLDFIPKALEKGAVCVVSDRIPEVDLPCLVLVDDPRRALGRAAANLFGNPSTDLGVIAVTGSDGKSSTTFMICAGVEGASGSCGLLGTVFRRWPGHEEKADMTTPDPVRLQRYLKMMRDAGTKVVAMEASSHALDQGRLAGVDVNVGVFTNLTRDHLDYHKTIDAYRSAKALLFSEVLKESPSAVGAVINQDDPAAGYFASKSVTPVVTYGFSEEADFRVLEAHYTIDGTQAVISSPQGSFRIHLNLVGKHNVYNAMAAMAALHLMGLDLEGVLSGIQNLKRIPGRLDRVDVEDFPAAVFVDYAHTPAALSNVIRVLRPLTKGKLIVVFGAGGDRDRGKRPLMGRAAAEADFVVITSDNPRTEEPLSIIREIEKGFLEVVQHPPYVVIPDRREGICRAVREARQGDVVLIAGKGHEDYQIIGTTKRHFDDNEVARECMENAGK